MDSSIKLPVVRGRTLVGMSTRSDRLAFMRVREDVGALPRQFAQDAPDQADRPATKHPVGP